MAACVTLQDVFREQAKPSNSGRLLLYPIGNTHSPLEITYTDLYRLARCNSHKIRSLDKFNPGRPILLHFDDHWDTILWFWSVLLAGGLPVLSTPFSNVEQDRHKHIKALSALLGSPICLTTSRLLYLFGESQNFQLRPIENLLTASQAESGLHDELRPNIQGCNCGSYTKTRAQDHQNGDFSTCYDTQSNDLGTRGCSCIEGTYNMKRAPVILMLTSGSTGNAKAVQFTHMQILAALAGKAAVRPLPLDRPFLNWIGMDHVAGLIEIHLLALWLGVDQVHVSAADVVPSPRTFLDMLNRHQISRTFAPNFFLAKLVSADNSVVAAEDEWDLSSLVGVVSGGEANDVQTCVAVSALFQKYGAPSNVLIIGFGMTETCAGSIYSGSCPDYDVSQGHSVASVGKCISGIEMRITTLGSPTGVAAPGEPGDLELRGSVVFEGYYRNQIATDEAFTPDHWFRTGDRGIIDSNGHLNLVGRSKEVINIRGVKVAIADVQQAIEQAVGERVARLVVFPSKTAHTEQVTIILIPKDFPIRDEEIMNITRLATQACLLSTATLPFVFPLSKASLPRLPTSTLGKISRSKLALLLEHGEFAHDIETYAQAMQRAAENMHKCDGSLPTETEARLIEDIAAALDTNPNVLGIHRGTCIFDIGFTSMHVIKLKHRIDRQWGIDLPIIHIMKNPPVRSLAANINAQLHQPRVLSSKQNPVSAYDPVVILQEKGTGTPLWLIHPGVGEVLVFIRLAHHLGTDNRSVFALRAAGFESSQQLFGSIGEVIDVYTAAIRRCQVHGPYALAGYSYGTMLAFEIAKRLKGFGEEVGFLGSFNLPPHIKFRIRQLNWSTCLLHLAHFLELVTEDVSEGLAADSIFCTLPRAEAIRRVLEIADASRLDELKMETEVLLRWVDVVFGLQRIAADYDPSGEVDNIDIFHAMPLKSVACSQEEWLCEHLSKWADFVREPPRFHAVQGAHYTMIGPKYVKSFAATLIKALRARGI